MKTINSFRSKFFALVLALVASVSSYAKDGYPDFQVDELYYNFLEGDSVQVTFLMPPAIPTEVAADTSNKKNVSGAGYGHLTEIVIPSTVIYEDKTYHVTRIGHGAFMYCPYLMHIDLPTSIKSIGEGAFHNCRYLSSITLNEGLESIEQQAFWGCPTLKEVSLPSTLKSLKQKVFYDSKALSKVICKALVPPSVEKDLLTGTDNYNASIIPNATLYVPAESLEAYKTAAAWKDFGQILPITWSEVCYEYRDFNLTIQLFPRKSSLVYTLYHTDDRTIQPPYVDSVWILDPELDKQNPLHVHTLYAQPGDTIDLSFLEKNKPYILKVHINECQMSRVFPHRVVKWEYKWCNKWNVMWFDGMRFDETARTSKYRLGKDTVIGDYTYRKFTSRTSVRFTEDWKVYVYYEGFDDNDPYTPDLPTGEYLAYDFSAQVGDTLEVFSGIGTYSTYPCIVDEVQTDPKTGLRTITLHKICRMDIDGDGIEEDYDDREMRWIEGVGSPEGFLISDLPCGWVGGGTNHLLCAYKGDELIYTDSFYERFGCDYNAGVVSDDLFPTLSGLQRTICREYCEQADNKTRIEQFTNLTTRTETGAPYIYYSPFLLREKDNKILIYSRSLNKDLVLYDFNLQVGDSLPMLYIDFFAKDDWIADRDMEIWCVVDYHKDLEGNILPADTLIVTDVSMITLLDGKEYKKWTFNNGMEYVEGIGSFGNGQWSGDFFQLIANKGVPTCLLDEHLVCASKNGQLLYKMDEAEMERLGAECQCEVETSYKSQWCNTWNVFTHSGGARLDSEETWQYKLDRDTIINGKLYSTVIYYLTSDPSREYYMGAVRFGDDRKVYRAIGNSESVVYDFTAQVGDTLGPGVVYEVQVDSLTTLKTIHFHPYDRYEDEYIEYATVTWIEGVGSTDGFLLAKDYGTAGGASFYLLCAYRDDELKYEGNKNLGCRYNAGEVTHEHFPTLAGLSRTIHEERSMNDTTRRDDFTKVVLDIEKPTLYHSQMYLREEDNKIFVISRTYKNLYDLYEYVLYDFTLEVGDSLPMLYIDYYDRGTWGPVYPHSVLNVVNYRKEADGTVYPGDTLVVTEVSTITLLDGKEYKKWTFNNGMEYAEGIGSLSGDFYELIANKRTTEDLTASHLVCASQNGVLLYQMDDTEMERLGAECLCEYNDGPKKDNAKDGKIGGRPTPTQWNMLEMVVREMENNKTILQAETFSYTLEDNSRILNNKTYFDLARQSTRDTAITKSVVGALHFSEDEGNRVYFLCDGMEYLLYDFTAEPGDSIEIFAGINNYPQATTYTHVVTSKDTLENRACRMVLEVVFPNQTGGTNLQKVWLAGLGSLDGIVHNSAQLASNARSAETESSVMLCAWREDDCLYTTDHPEFDKVGCVYNLPTAVDDIQTPETQYQKIIHNGHLYILRNNKIYDVLGTPLTNH